jgi:hypothetical protein
MSARPDPAGTRPDPAQERRRRWTRGYPPLIMLALAILAVVIVLPSSLNLPQSNPTAVLEYAPVPPQDRNSPPLQGNLSNLGLGTSRTLALPALPPPPAANGLIQGIGGRPNQKQCVGTPPRQTEDASSPPCAPFFQGDNFGPTYQGVTRNEIKVLVYLDAGNYGLVGQGETTPAPNTYVDIDKPRLPNCPADNGGTTFTDPDQCDHVIIRMLKGFSHYFNDRFQTYNRHVHYWAFFGPSLTASAASRRGDAVANVDKLHPFAVIDSAVFFGFNQEYDTAMAQLHVLTFGSTQASLTNDFYKKNAPLSWGFFPDVQHWASLYSTYVCQTVAPYPVSHYGNPQGAGPPNGGKRTFGLWYTIDPAWPQLRLFTNLIKGQVRSQCGATGVEATYSHNGFAVDNSDTGSDAAQGVAKFQTNNVTTILYLGGTEGKLSEALDAVHYYPEIVVAGNLGNDNNFIGQVQNQTAWQNAWAMTYHVRISRLQDAPGYRAYKEGDPSGDDNAGTFARDSYRDHFMVFQAIQVAGPRLSPESVNQGFHAIPAQSSPNPFSPALFFDAGDYTALKDGAEEWWDPQGQSPPGGTPSRRPGCYRMTREGKRFLAGRWSPGDDVFKNTSDPCTGFSGSINLNPNPPSP